MLMRFLTSLLILGSTLAGLPALAQNLSLGIMAGGSVTDGFLGRTSPDAIRYFSTSKDYLAGPTLEWRFSPAWSVEGDALFRELHLGLESAAANGSAGGTNREPVVTWEFPVLAKYRLTTSGLRPFVEAGGSFRSTGNLNGSNPSHYGFTAGAGVEIQAGKLTFAPVVRYTRWAADSGVNAYRAVSNPNQLELAVGASTATASNRHPLGARISLGVLAGVGLTEDSRSSSFAFASGTESFSQTTSPRRGLIGGPALELGLPANFSFEADAIYRPIRAVTATSGSGFVASNYAFSLGNWDLPLLATYRFHSRFAAPIVEGGPAFRVGSGDLSHYGATAGMGLEFRVRGFRIVPMLRYSHWAADPLPGGAESIRNRLELFAAFWL
jgi:hypothetical protein